MSYQNPAFMTKNHGADLAIANILPRSSTGLSDDDKRALVDSSTGINATYTCNVTGSCGVSYNFDAPVRVNQCIIPAGHDMAGFAINIFSDNDSPGFPSAILRRAITPTDSSLIDFSFALVTTDVGWLYQMASSGANTFNLSEFWVGEKISLTTNDARVDSGFLREYEHDLREENYGGRTATLELSPARRVFSLQIRDLDPSGTDFATLEEVIRDGRSKPFWYWTPDDTDTGPYLVKLSRAATRVQSSKVPLTSSRYEVSLEMIEQVT